MFMKNAEDFVESQNEAMKQELARGAGADVLAERLQKITMANDVIDLGNDVRVKNFKSQALRNPALAKEALANFDKMNTLLDNLKKITRKDVNLTQIEA